MSKLHVYNDIRSKYKSYMFKIKSIIEYSNDIFKIKTECKNDVFQIIIVTVPAGTKFITKCVEVTTIDYFAQFALLSLETLRNKLKLALREIKVQVGTFQCSFF